MNDGVFCYSPSSIVSSWMVIQYLYRERIASPPEMRVRPPLRGESVMLSVACREMTPYTLPRKVDSHSRGLLFLPHRHLLLKSWITHGNATANFTAISGNGRAYFAWGRSIWENNFDRKVNYSVWAGKSKWTFDTLWFIVLRYVRLMPLFFLLCTFLLAENRAMFTKYLKVSEEKIYSYLCLGACFSFLRSISHLITMIMNHDDLRYTLNCNIKPYKTV